MHIEDRRGFRPGTVTVRLDHGAIYNPAALHLIRLSTGTGTFTGRFRLRAGGRPRFYNGWV